MKTLSLKNTLDKLAQPGELYEELPDGKLLCYACGHRCKISEGRDGICKVRFNKEGKLYVPKNYVNGLAIDPIEKKPFYHAYPGTGALSFGMLGCDFHCSYCQNWVSSQALRDPIAGSSIEEISSDEIIAYAKKTKTKIVTSTYNEPLITSDWAVEIFKKAKKEGLVTSYVSNGNATPEVLDYLKPHLDLFKIDLKCFNDKNYRKLGGVLDNILKSIQMVYEKGFWLEVVTLIVPGFNDSDEELRKIADFLSDISPLIPWHVSAFHKDYKMTGPDNTPVETLIRACEIGEEVGLKYVYAGNLPGMVGKWENTYCHNCRTLLIERYGFRVVNNLQKGNQCPKCDTEIPGRFS